MKPNTEDEPRERGMKDGLIKRGQTWSYVYEDARQADGTRVRRWVGGFPTRKAAKDARTTRLGAIQRGEYVAPTKVTLGEVLDQWLASIAPTVAASTSRRFAQLVRVQLKPALGARPIARLTPLDLELCYADLQTRGRVQGQRAGAPARGLSPTTARHCHNVLALALDAAKRWKLVAVNVARDAKPPRPAETELTVLDEAQAAQLLDLVAGTRLHAPVVLTLLGALRRGEALAVRWRDLDPTTGHLQVAQSLEVTPEGIRFKAPKTKAGRRVVVLPRLALEHLRRVRREQAEAGLRLGKRFEDADLICAQVDGRPWLPDLISKAFLRFVRQAGLPQVGLHALRHTAASLLLVRNVHPKVVAAQLGHSRVGITLDRYSHLIGGTLQEAAAAQLDEALRSAPRATALLPNRPA